MQLGSSLDEVLRGVPSAASSREGETCCSCLVDQLLDLLRSLQTEAETLPPWRPVAPEVAEEMVETFKQPRPLSLDDLKVRSGKVLHVTRKSISFRSSKGKFLAFLVFSQT